MQKFDNNLGKFEFSFDIKSIDSEERIIRGVASIEEVDRDSEIVAMDALRASIPVYMTNPVIRYKHKEEIGTAVEVDIQGKEFLVAAKIGKNFEPADTVWKKIEQGILKSFSIGGKIKKREAIDVDGKEVSKITKLELYEISVVDIPANRKSVFNAIAKSLEKGEKPPSDWMERCKNRVQGKVKDPYAVCTATWKKKKKKMAELELEEVDEYIKMIDEELEELLEKYGVRGMRWGHRKPFSGSFRTFMETTLREAMREIRSLPPTKDPKKIKARREHIALIETEIKRRTKKSSLSEKLGGETKPDEGKNNKEEKTMPEEKEEETKPEVEPKVEEKPEEKPEAKPEGESQPETKEEPEGEKMQKMYTAEDLDKAKAEAVKKAVESESVRKAALVGEGETEKQVKMDVQKIVDLAGNRFEGGLTKVFGVTDLNGVGGTIVDTMKGIDNRKDQGSFKEAYETMTKATLTTTGGAGTAGYALIPVYVDPDIIDRTRREIPFIELVPRKAVQGLTYDYNAITTTASAVSLYEDAALADVTDTYTRTSVTIRYLYSVGRVTGQAIAASRGYIDKLNQEVQTRTIALKRWEDQLAIQDETAPSFTGLQGTISSNETALDGPLTISAIRTEVTECLDDGANRGSMIILTTNTLADSLRGLLQDYQRWTNTTKLAWGIETMSFDGIPVIVDRYVPAEVLFIVDMSVVFMAVLQDMVYGELARTNDSNKFELHMYEALVIRAEQFCSELTGCT